MAYLRFTLQSFIDRHGNPADYRCYYKGRLITRVENAGNLTSLYRIWLQGERQSTVISKDAVIEAIS